MKKGPRLLVGRLILILGVFYLSNSCSTQPEKHPHAHPRIPSEIDLNAVIQQLVESLRSDNVLERERAERELVALGDSVIPYIERARSDFDPEVKGRLEHILEELRWWDWTYWSDTIAVDLRTGRSIWRAENGRSYFTQRDVFLHVLDGTLERRSLKDGRLIWRVTTERPQVQFVWTGGKLIENGVTIRAIEAQSGEELWRIVPKGSAWVESCSSRLLVTTPDTSSLHDLSTGAPLWAIGKGCNNNGARFLPGGDVIIESHGNLGRYSGADGTEKWRVTIGGGSYPVIVAGECVLVGKYLLDASSGRTIQAFEQPGWEMLQSSDGKQVFVQRFGKVCALDPASGRTIWTREFSDHGPDKRFWVSCALEGDHLFVCDIQLYCLRTLTGEILWSSPLTELVPRGSPHNVISDLDLRPNLIVVRNHTYHRACVEAFSKLTGILLSRWVSEQ
jgi:outer membrane protein assembly factor BamB